MRKLGRTGHSNVSPPMETVGAEEPSEPSTNLIRVGSRQSAARSRRRPSRTILAVGVIVGALSVATAGAATGVIDVGDDSRSKVGDILPRGAPTGGDSLADETVVATGTSPVGGPWRITSYTSEATIVDGMVTEPAGLPCIRMMLVNPGRTPITGTGWCGDVRGGFGESALPVQDDAGRREIILFGRAPEEASVVEVRSDSGELVREEETYDGPAHFSGDVWAIVVPAGPAVTSVAWKGGSGAAPRDPKDVSTLVEHVSRSFAVNGVTNR